MFTFTKTQTEKLLRNGREQAETGEADHTPVVKLFNPTGAGTWLITELDPEDPDRAFGLADLGFGTPELGWIYLPELRAHRGRFGLPIERDLYFRGAKPISEYASEARAAGSIAA